MTVRNLDEIQEQEPLQGAGKLGAMIMASFGGACIVFCSLALVHTPKDGAAPKPADPLGDLVASAQPAAKKTAKPQIDPADVTFPEMLTDQPQKTTAMAAVQNEPVRRPGTTDDEQLPRLAPAGMSPPPATDRLAVVPLPAQDVLADRSLPVAPVDRLQTVAAELSREPAGAMVEAGAPGGYQLQVSSFKTKEEAEAFAVALRHRGHHAHVEEAAIAGRGTWFRVRVGPFKYKRSAQLYREEFEAKERLVSFIVEPPKTKVSVSLAEAD